MYEVSMQPLRKATPVSSSRYESAEISDRRAKLSDLIRRESFGRGRITLASGRVSDFYFNLKPTMLHPAGAAWLSEMVLDVIQDLDVEYLGGLEMGAVPIAGAIAAASYNRDTPIATFFVRKKPKDHGDRLNVEGLRDQSVLKGKNIVIIDDVTTTGGSAMQAVRTIREAGGNIVLVLTIVDRQEGASETFRAEGLPFRALFTADEFLKT
jgi:orotate phosphoribosyltransferase